MENDDKCPNCKGKNTVRHTSPQLRKKKIYVVQCFDCDYMWEIDWEKEDK